MHVKKKEVVMDLENKLNEMEAIASKLENALAEKDKLIGELQDKINALAESNKKLVKALDQERERANYAEEIAREGREQKVAEGIMDSILADSKLPERLYGKVKGYVDYKDFRGDSEFTADSEGAKKFTAAFKAEVADWEASIGDSPRIGLREPKKDAGSDETDLLEYARNLARQFAGRIRSDEK